MAKEDLILTQFVENMSFYGDMLFKQLTLLMGGVTVIGAGIAEYPNVNLFDSLCVRAALAMVGMLFTGAMWVMEISSSTYWVAHREEARTLLGTTPWPRPAKRIPGLTATNAVLALHFAFFWFWFWCATKWYPRCLPLVLGVLFGILLAVFSVLNYWPLWTHREQRG